MAIEKTVPTLIFPFYVCIVRVRKSSRTNCAGDEDNYGLSPSVWALNIARYMGVPAQLT